MTKNRSAITLVELLIASAIFSVVVLTIYSAFHAGVFGYRDIEGNIDASQSAQQILGRINLDLRNSFVYSQNESKFTGANDAISFLALADRFSEDKIIQDYGFISYQLEDKRLMRLCLKNQETLNNNLRSESEEMGSDIEELSFSYGYMEDQAIKWKDSWDDKAALPLAVKVKLKIKNKIEQDFERTIFLPLT